VFREADFSCYNVTPLPCSALFATIYKRPLNEEEGLFGWAFCFWVGFLPLLSFLLLALEKKLLLWAFRCRKLLEGKRIVEREKIAEGIDRVFNIGFKKQS
jgi:hypothetical protein